MNIRDALISQSPSLALQRAAQSEIAVLDGNINLLQQEVAHLRRKVQWKQAQLDVLRKGVAQQVALVPPAPVYACKDCPNIKLP